MERIFENIVKPHCWNETSNCCYFFIYSKLCVLENLWQDYQMRLRTRFFICYLAAIFTICTYFDRRVSGSLEIRLGFRHIIRFKLTTLWLIVNCKNQVSLTSSEFNSFMVIIRLMYDKRSGVCYPEMT